MDASLLPPDEERTLLRASLRGFLDHHWPAADAVAADPARVRSLMAQRGLGLPR